MQEASPEEGSDHFCQHDGPAPQRPALGPLENGRQVALEGEEDLPGGAQGQYDPVGDAPEPTW